MFETLREVAFRAERLVIIYVKHGYSNTLWRAMLKFRPQIEFDKLAIRFSSFLEVAQFWNIVPVKISFCQVAFVFDVRNLSGE